MLGNKKRIALLAASLATMHLPSEIYDTTHISDDTTRDSEPYTKKDVMHDVHPSSPRVIASGDCPVTERYSNDLHEFSVHGERIMARNRKTAIKIYNNRHK